MLHRVWESGSLTLLQTIPMSADPQIGDSQVSCLWTSSGHVLSVSLNGDINLLDLSSSGSVASRIQSNQLAISCLSIDPSSHSLLTGSIDGVVLHRDLTLLRPTEGQTSSIRKVKGVDKKSIPQAR